MVVSLFTGGALMKRGDDCGTIGTICAGEISFVLIRGVCAAAAYVRVLRLRSFEHIMTLRVDFIARVLMGKQKTHN